MKLETIGGYPVQTSSGPKAALLNEPRGPSCPASSFMQCPNQMLQDSGRQPGSLQIPIPKRLQSKIRQGKEWKQEIGGGRRVERILGTLNTSNNHIAHQGELNSCLFPIHPEDAAWPPGSTDQ